MMSTSIYQIQYNDNVLGEFDPAFIKYDCRENPEFEKREVAHMLRFYEEGIWKKRGDQYFGLVSPKFSSKTQIGGRFFIDWINDNPGYDVYFINPFPQLAYWNYNVWTQGEYWHPGLIELTNELFDIANVNVDINEMSRNTSKTLLYSNYWCGNESFWHRYMTFVKKILNAIDYLPVAKRIRLYEIAPHYAPATYFPFIFERIFSTFLLIENDINSLSYSYDQDVIRSRCGNELEQFIITEWGPMIDSWDSTNRCDLEYRKIFKNLRSMLDVSLKIINNKPDVNLTDEHSWLYRLTNIWSKS